MTNLQSPKKLLMVSVSPEVGGAEKVIKSLLKELRSEEAPDFVTRLLLLRKAKDPSPFLRADQRGYFKCLFESADLIHSHLFLPGFLVALRKLWNPSLRWVHTVHYADYTGQTFPRLKKFLDTHFIFPRADHLVFVSAATQEAFQKYEKAEVILNGVSFHRAPAAAARVMNHRAPVLGCVAMFREEKGLHELLEIFAEFRKKYPKATLKIAGDGPQRSLLVKKRSQLGLDRSVEFCGYKKNLQSFFESIDIYVQPSLSESFGLALLEAMPFAKPIVAANVGNIPHLLQSTYGLTVPRDNAYVENFVSALSYACHHGKSLGEAALAGHYFWKEQLSETRMAAHYFKIYQEETRPAVCMLAPIVTHAKGGLQQQLYLQSRELSQRGFRVFILQNFDPGLNQQSPYWKHVQFLMVHQPLPKWFKGFPLVERLRGVGFILGGFWHLWRQHNAIQILHAHQLYSPTLLGILGKKFFKKPLVVKVTASGELGELAQLRKLPFFETRKRAFQNIDRVFALTEEMRQEVLELGLPPEKVLILPNSVELPPFQLQDLAFVENEVHLLFVGRLAKEKSVETLLKAADLLCQRGYKIVVDIVGAAYKGRDVSEALRSLVQSFQSGVKVEFWGERKDVARFYQSQPVFVLPSSSEGMSNALLEAMAYGLVCVASDIPANQFLIQHRQNGLLFKQGQAADLAIQLEILIQDQRQEGIFSRKLGVAARNTIEENFSTSVIGKRIADVYADLITKKVKIMRLFSRLNIGGPAIHVVNLTYGLNKYGYHSQLVVGSLGVGEGDMSYYATEKNVTPLVIPEFQAAINPKKDVIAFWKILQLMWQERPDIVHTHTFKAGLLGRLAAIILRVPCRVHTYHGHLLEGYGNRLKTRLIARVESLLGKGTHQVLAVSRLVAKDLMTYGVVPQKKMNVIELGFDVDSLLRESQRPSSLRQRLNLGSEAILIGIAGRLVPVKSVDLFLQSMDRLLKEFPQVHVAVIGDGPERARLEELADRISPKIYFTGWILPLAPEFKDLDLLVCSSKNEGTSVSVIEAVLCRVPVLSTNVGGMADLLAQGQWGDLVDYNQSVLTMKLRHKIKTLLEPKSEAFQKLQRQRDLAQKEFYKRFHIDRLLADVHRVYRRGHLAATVKHAVKNDARENKVYASLLESPRSSLIMTAPNFGESLKAETAAQADLQSQ